MASKLKAIEASAFVEANDEIKNLLLSSNVIPVNDDLMEYWDNEDPLFFLYGSYGSGKSIFLVDKLIRKAIENPYFRCYYGRKIFKDVRGSTFQTIVDRIKETKKEHLFKYSETPNGSMNIVCRENGNSFIPFGANNAASLKSVKDPTDFFLEELDQFTFADFGLINTRLRTDKAKTQMLGAFNTEKIYPSHWIRKVLFDGEFKDMAKKVKINFSSNYFIDRDAYFQKLQLMANGNAAVLNAIANGEWGMVRTGAEWLKSLDETKHIRPGVRYVPGIVYASLDENVTPYVTNTIWQVRGGNLVQIGEILSTAPKNNAVKAAESFADYLDSINHRDMVWICGDPSARKRSTVDENNKSFYTKFIEVLTKRGYRCADKVMKSAPEVALSGTFINAILEGNIPGKSITISDQCFESIEDYILTKEDAEGYPFPEKKKDEETGITYESRGHILDSLRYFVILVLNTEFQAFKGRRKTNTSRLAGFVR